MNNIEGPKFPVTPTNTPNQTPKDPTIEKTQKQKNKITPPKSKEAEDLPGRIQRHRSSSVSRVKAGEATGIDADKIETAKRSGELWECIARKPEKEGGYTYTFRLKDEYDDVTSTDPKRAKAAKDRMDAILPAAEKRGLEVLPFCADPDSKRYFNFIANRKVAEHLKENPEDWHLREELRRKIYNQNASLYKQTLQATIAIKELGYEAEFKRDGVYFHCPDKEVLEARWEKLREKRPRLPQLDIVSGEGIADDMAFVESFLAHDALLSSGKEFLHDQFQHVIPVLTMLLSSKDAKQEYQKEKIRLIQLVGQVYRQVMIVEHLLTEETDDKNVLLARSKINEIKALLGALVDTASNSPSMSVSQYFNKGNMDMLIALLISNSAWKQYWQKRFGEDYSKEAEKLITAFMVLKDIEYEFDYERRM